MCGPDIKISIDSGIFLFYWVPCFLLHLMRFLVGSVFRWLDIQICIVHVKKNFKFIWYIHSVLVAWWTDGDGSIIL